MYNVLGTRVEGAADTAALGGFVRRRGGGEFLAQRVVSFSLFRGEEKNRRGGKVWISKKVEEEGSE